MSMQEAPVSAARGPGGGPLAESEAYSLPGIVMLLIGVVCFLGAVALLTAAIGARSNRGSLIAPGVLLLAVAAFTYRGLTQVVAGEARVVQLFGRYRGTLREPGLHWVNVLADRRRVSVRIRNHESAMAKVNDADGNPIEIAAVAESQRTRCGGETQSREMHVAVRKIRRQPCPMPRDRKGLRAVLNQITQSADRSALFWWLVEHHDEVATAASGRRLQWARLCTGFAEIGLRGPERHDGSSMHQNRIQRRWQGIPRIRAESGYGTSGARIVHAESRRAASAMGQ